MTNLERLVTAYFQYFYGKYVEVKVENGFVAVAHHYNHRGSKFTGTFEGPVEHIINMILTRNENWLNEYYADSMNYIREVE